MKTITQNTDNSIDFNSKIKWIFSSFLEQIKINILLTQIFEILILEIGKKKYMSLGKYDTRL